jgi:hypothetical protein
VTLRAIGGLIVLHLLFLGVGAGILWGLRGWRVWTDFVRLAGVAYLLGVAALMALLTLALVAGLGFGPPLMIACGVVLVSGGLLRGWRNGRGLPRLIPRGWRLPSPSVVSAIFIAALVVYFEAFFRSERLAELYDWDAWFTWTLKAKTLFYFGGMEQWVFGTAAHSGGVLTSYPPGFPALQAASFHAMGSADVVTLNLTYWFLTLGFVAAVAGLVAPRVRALILLPVLLLALVVPGLTGIPVPGGADRPLAYLVATAALLVVLWLDERQGWQLAAATLLLAGAFLTKREGPLLGACVLAAAFAVTWSDRRGAWPRLGLTGLAALVLALPWWIWVATQDFPDEGLETGIVETLENVDRARPSLELALRAMFGYDFWLVLPAVAVAAAVLALLAGARKPAGFVLVFLGLALAANTWITWSQTLFGLTLDYSLNPATRFMVTPVLTAAAVTPLLLERAWVVVSGQRGLGPRPEAVRAVVLGWAIVAFALVAYPASMAAGYSGFRLPGGPPSFPDRGECARAPVAGEPVRVVFSYERSYRNANAVRERAREAGFETTEVARDGCGQLRIFVDDVSSLAAGEDLGTRARVAGLQPTLERDPDD